jgi:MFS transporter, PAT family, beta-lactamase induction signal transducer AmpG
VLVISAVFFALLALVSATHDIAIDGLYLEALDKAEQAKFVGLRAPAYRFATYIVGGPLITLCGTTSFSVGLAVAAAIMAVLFLYHAAFLPKSEAPKLPFTALPKALLKPAVSLVLAGIAGGVAALYALLRVLEETAPDVAKKLGLAGLIGLALLLFFVVALAALPKVRALASKSESFYGRAFVAFLDQKYIARVLAFVILFRIGESFLITMKTPFCTRALGLTTAEYGLVNGWIGMFVSLAAPAVGGYLIAKHGLARWIWPFTLAQNGLHLLFAVAAVYAPEIAASHQTWGPVEARLVIVAGIIVVEVFGAGLGTAVFMTYLMRTCRPEFKAAHFAIVTALMSVSFTLAGVLSGPLADWLGFPLYFAFTFLVTIPGMALTLFVPHVVDRDSPPVVAAR